MSLSEKLIVAAKKGNAREVRKLLGRGALFTKDQVVSQYYLVLMAETKHGGRIPSARNATRFIMNSC